MSCTAHITDQLRARGFRVTAQRLAVLDALHHGGHQTPGEVHARVAERVPGLPEATVYRALEFLADEQFILAGRGPDGRLRYELSADQHHHLVCRACGAAVEIEHAAVEGLYRQIGARSGFHLEPSHLTLFGLCPDCHSREGKI